MQRQNLFEKTEEKIESNNTGSVSEFSSKEIKEVDEATAGSCRY